MKIKHSERGQVLVLIAFAIIVLAGMVGLVVDGGNSFLDRRNAQNAADSAVLASALARVKGDPNWTGAALESAATNGYNNDGVRNIVELHTPPQDGPYAGDINYVQVVITSHVPTYFARVIGRSELINIVEATARTKLPEVKELLKGRAVVSLAPNSDCNNRKSFWVHGEATLDISGGGVLVNSNNQTCALFQNGNGSVRVNGFPIEVVGGASIQKPTLLSPNVAVGVAAEIYPPPFVLPELGCGAEAEVSLDGTSMTAGSWDGAFPPEGVTRLEKGVYCLNDGMDIQHDIEGNSVVFKVNKGEVRFSNSANIVLDAPHSGTNAGLLIYLPMDNNSKVVLNGGAGSNIRGTILAPAAPILFKGMESASGFHSQIIGYTIEADGQSNIKIDYKDEQNWDSLSMPEVQLSE
jgi:putative Flp pilus-assembly TadE/G-like protein